MNSETLKNTIENLQIHTLNENVLQELLKLEKMTDKESYFSKHKKQIIERLHHPSLTGVNQRNTKATSLLKCYSEQEAIGDDILTEIDAIIKNKWSQLNNNERLRM